jgi:hypothetical protein
LPGDSQFLHPAETTVTFTVGFNPDHNPSLWLMCSLLHNHIHSLFNISRLCNRLSCE